MTIKFQKFSKNISSQIQKNFGTLKQDKHKANYTEAHHSAIAYQEKILKVAIGKKYTLLVHTGKQRYK